MLVKIIFGPHRSSDDSENYFCNMKIILRQILNDTIRDVTYMESKIRSDSLWIKPIFETNHCNLPTKATEIKNTRSLRLGSLYNLQLQFYPKK